MRRLFLVAVLVSSFVGIQSFSADEKHNDQVTTPKDKTETTVVTDGSVRPEDKNKDQKPNLVNVPSTCTK